jgi:predicted enzyme related to lactoylglutathione lyase
MTVKGVRAVHYSVTDVARSRAFYERALGCKVKFADGSRWVQFEGSGAALALASAEEAAPGQTGAVVVFDTDDLDGACRQIVEAGGRIVDRRDMGSHGVVATFTDPEGNIAQIFARAAP